MNADSLNFRRALSQFATGVTVITTLDAAREPVGMTVSSFNSVSLDPPLVLWSLKKDAWSAPAFLACQRFSIHVLSAEQISLSNRFAQRGADKFGEIDWIAGDEGIPRLSGCLARFDCQTWACYEGGDHFIHVGRVVSFDFDDAQRPLIFSKGGYGVPIPRIAGNEATGGKSLDLSSNLLYLLRAALNTSTERLYPELSDRFGITPEEWRVLAHLDHAEHNTLDCLAGKLEVPVGPLKTQVSSLVERSILAWCDGQAAVALTVPGQELANAVVAFMQRDDELCVAEVKEAGATHFKHGLRTLAGRRARRSA